MRVELLRTTAMFSVLLTPCAAWAQSASPAAQVSTSAPSDGPIAGATPQAGGLSDIVVTAQRRAEKLQDVPIAATALTGSQLDEKAVNRISDLQFAAPSLSVTDAGLTQSVNIRGIGIASGSPAVANGVAIYINGVYQPPLLTSSSFYDIGSVEVLRGPQGTLVGSNSTGGAIFVNAQRPLLNGFSGFLEGGLGNYADRTVQGALNIPLTGNLAIRAAGNFENRDSYYTDIGPYHNDAGKLNEKAGRIGVLWTPANFQALGHVEWVDRDTGGYAYRPLAGTPYAAGATPDPWTLDYDTPTRNREAGFKADLELRYQLGNGITLRSMTGYVNNRIRNLYDIDATALPPSSTEDQFVREREVVQEFNLLSPTTARFNWILGGYYQHNSIDVAILNRTGSPVDPTHIVIQDNKTTLGVFAQGGYKVTDRVELQLGMRYSHYAVTQEGSVAIGYGTLFGPSGLSVADLGNTHKDGRLTGKVNVNYKPDDDNLIYAFVARGYKPGGANSVTSQFTPETVLDYEAGWKSTMLGNHVRTQISAFFMDYRDFQFDKIDTNTGQSGVSNVASAKIYGVEGQLQAKLGGFDVDGGFAYVHSKIGSLTAVNTRLVPAAVTLGPECGVSATAGCTDYTAYFQQAGGGPNPLSPKWSFNVGVDYQVPIRDGVSLTPRLNYAYVGPQYATYFYNPQFDYLAGRGLLSALLTLRTRSWTLEAYGRNLTNKRYETGLFLNAEFFGAPREYGLKATARF